MRALDVGKRIRVKSHVPFHGGKLGTVVAQGYATNASWVRIDGYDSGIQVSDPNSPINGAVILNPEEREEYPDMCAEGKS